ncbi:MAG: DUF1264 domain-containing protein [Acidimicrobiales bacterium]
MAGSLKVAAPIVALIGAAALVGARLAPRVAAPMTPADGHTVHVLAPHAVEGKVMGPYHHYCKVLSPEPVIECLCYESTDSTAMIAQVEYIYAKTITRTDAISLADWNKNWHDHTQEIQTGRVQVLDLPAEDAKKVADLVATTDGIIFHLWQHGQRVPTGKVAIAQSVGHVNLTQAEKFMHRGH